MIRDFFGGRDTVTHLGAIAICAMARGEPLPETVEESMRRPFMKGRVNAALESLSQGGGWKAVDISWNADLRRALATPFDHRDYPTCRALALLAQYKQRMLLQCQKRFNEDNGMSVSVVNLKCFVEMNFERFDMLVLAPRGIASDCQLYDALERFDYLHSCMTGVVNTRVSLKSRAARLRQDGVAFGVILECLLPMVLSRLHNTWAAFKAGDELCGSISVVLGAEDVKEEIRRITSYGLVTLASAQVKFTGNKRARQEDWAAVYDSKLVVDMAPVYAAFNARFNTTDTGELLQWADRWCARDLISEKGCRSKLLTDKRKCTWRHGTPPGWMGKEEFWRLYEAGGLLQGPVEEGDQEEGDDG